MRLVRGATILVLERPPALVEAEGSGTMATDPRWPGSSDGSAGEADPEAVEPPPKPLAEMTRQEIADWAHADPDRARRFLRQQEQLIRQRKRLLRSPSPVSAFTGAFLLVSLGTFIYAMASGYGFLQHFSGRLTVSIVVTLLVVWLVLWGLIAAWRRRSDRHDSGQGRA
jgi:hypothetical protein